MTGLEHLSPRAQEWARRTLTRRAIEEALGVEKEPVRSRIFPEELVRRAIPFVEAAAAAGNPEAQELLEKMKACHENVLRSMEE